MSSISKLSNNPHLIVVATPIGNLKEINERAINAINNNKYLFCEDTRTTKQLLSLYDINYQDKYFISYHKYNEQSRIEEILQILQNNNIVLLCDAGYPGFSDPGYAVINVCIKNNIFVEVINGANAFINALITSGWSNLPATFYGFIDWNDTKINDFIFPNTILCFYESVHRINKSLKIMYKIFGDINVCVVKELTKLNETHYYGNLADIEISDEELKGEFVILLNNLHIKASCNNLSNIKNEFNLFTKAFNKSNLKNKIKLFLEIKKIKDIKPNELYDEIIKEKNNEN